MGATTSAGLLQVIAAAVTPVVMISAAAVLILGVNQKHASLGDRVRALSAEFRAAGTTAERRESIRAQIRLFERRLGYVATAHLWLYASVVCFVGTVLVITLTARSPAWDRVALGIFVLGIALMLGAPIMEVVELRLAHRALDQELSDVFPGKASAGG
jgi:Protein of unknown function (DUF2721)